MKAIRRWATDVEEALLREDRLSTLPSHPSVIGESRESRLAAVLKRFLPSTLDVGRGQVIDMSGELSGQLDIIVARNDVLRLPLVGSDKGSSLFLPESVFAALEIKSRLTTRSIAAALRTLKSVHLGFMAHAPDIRSKERQRAGSHLSTDEVTALEELTSLLAPSSYVYAYQSVGPRGFDSFCRMVLDAVMETQIIPGALPSIIARPGVVAILNDSLLLSSESFGEEFLYAIRADPQPLYWILAHLTIKTIRTFGQPGVAAAPTEYVLEAHLDPLPEDWKLLKVTMANG